MERLEKLQKRINKFNNDRDWNQFHSPANLAKSISIESGELLECFQWNDKKYNINEVKEELADIFNYCLQMAEALKVNIVDITNEKISISEKKYPINKAKGKSTKYNKL